MFPFNEIAWVVGALVMILAGWVLLTGPNETIT